MNSIAVQVSDSAWQQALSLGGLGVRSISHHSSAAHVASLSSMGFSDAQNPQLSHTVDLFSLLLRSSLWIPSQPHPLSNKLEDHQFTMLMDVSSYLQKAVVIL